MKKILFLIAVSISFSAHAAVDYVAIGKLLTEAKAQMAQARTGIACKFKSLETDFSCVNIEIVDTVVETFHSEFQANMFACGDKEFYFRPANIIKNNMLEPAKNLAKVADSNDMVHAKITEVEKQLGDLVRETRELQVKSDLKKVYANKCLFGEDVPVDSIKKLICE